MTAPAVRLGAVSLLVAYLACFLRVLAAGGPLLGSLDAALAKRCYHAVPPLLFLPVYWSAGLVTGILSVAAWHLHSRRRRDAARVVAALLLTWGTYAPTKLLTAEPRPYVALGVPAARAGSTYESFPSGHAALGGVLLGVAAAGRATVLGLGALTLYVMASRMVFGMHHLSDVVVGAMLGTGMGLLLRPSRSLPVDHSG